MDLRQAAELLGGWSGTSLFAFISINRYPATEQNRTYLSFTQVQRYNMGVCIQIHMRKQYFPVKELNLDGRKFCLNIICG